MAGWLAGKAKGVSKRKTGINCPGRPHFSGNFCGQGDGDGRNSGPFNLALDQSHGLIADPSGGRQDGDINPVFF